MKQESVSDLVTGTSRVTVRDIAAETGLSIATISRVLNGNGHVASDTRERVRQIVDRLGDRAPEPRRRPHGRATRPPVFVRCPYLLTDYFGHIVTSIAETLALHDQRMLLDAGDAVVKSAVVRGLPRRGDMYGALLILPPEPRADLEALAARGYPFVVVDPRTVVPPGCVSISAAHFAGARAITRHLAALAEAGVLGEPGLIRHGEPAAKTGVRAGGELLDLRPRPTAVVCFNDKVAVGVLEAAAARGLRVPEDLSVAGFDDIDVSRATTPRLTTVR